MSWLNFNQSLNSLKGQITNFASEVLSEGLGDESNKEQGEAPTPSRELEEKCQGQELEIAALKKLNEELSASLQTEIVSKRNGVKEDECSRYRDLQAEPSKSFDETTQNHYERQIRSLQTEISALKQREDTVHNLELEVERLREENMQYSFNLDTLDDQHQQAMERLLDIKRDLQTNFELLKREHEDLKSANENYSVKVKDLLEESERKQKEINELKIVRSEYDTLHHKYQNLERIHSLLRENAEKFQEENQNLHEEVFKLQEQVTKLEHELETIDRQQHLTNLVPKEKFDEILKELNELKDRRHSNTVNLDEINIDDNAKSVIETLKRDITELKLELSQTQSDNYKLDSRTIKTEKIIQLYNKYVNFDLPFDYVGERPSADDSAVLYKLETVFKILSSYKKDIDILSHKISEKNLKINQLQAQVDDLTTENDFLTTDIQHYEREFNEMKKNNDFLISEIATLKNTSKLEPIIESHEDNLVKLETELADCNRMNKNFESEIVKIGKELDDVKTEKIILQESLADLKNKYSTLISELEMFKTQSQAVEELEYNANTKQAERLKKTTDEIDELRKRLNSAFAKNEQLSIDIHIIENEKVLLTNELEEMKLAFEKKSSLCRELEVSIVNLQQKILNLEHRLVDDSKTEKQCINEKKSNESDLDENSREVEASNHSKLLEKVDDNTLEEKRSLRETIDKLTKEIMDSKVYQRDLLSENDSLKTCIAIYMQNATKLQHTIKYLRAKLETIDSLNNHISELENENKSLIEIKVKLEADLSCHRTTIARLEEEHEIFLTNFYEKCSIIDSLKSTIDNLKTQMSGLEDITNVKEEEMKTPQQPLQSFDSHLDVIEQSKLISKETESRERLMTSQTRSEELEENKNIREGNETEIEEPDRSVVQSTGKAVINDKSLKMENELSELRNLYDQLKNTCLEYRTMLDKASDDKNELIKLVNVKHNESVQYHKEISRLNQVLLDQAESFQRKEHEILSKNDTESSSKCESLTLALAERDQTIIHLKQSVNDYKQMTRELNETIDRLAEKCDNLEKSLAIQLETVKGLTTENDQLTEKTENLSRELERLREHLVETEENHTQELMAADRKLSECQARLLRVEERAKQTSTLYTSSSIRANQEVETLRNQIKLLEKQRESVQNELSGVEDARARSDAALANLQLVLEQFQTDKERDIERSTEKLRNKLEETKIQNGALREELSQLTGKLNEARAGLQAAARLGDQLAAKDALLDELRERVRTLQAAADEERRRGAAGRPDRVDKNLVRNLVLNYVLAANNAQDKSRVLRVLSSVLDFNREECERLGLGAASRPADGLAAEFVRFLQRESRPPAGDAAPVPAPASAPAPARRLDTGVTQPRDTEGAILKRVLKDMLPQ